MAKQYEFVPYLLNARERQLTRAGQLIHLQPKAFDVLLYLLEHAGNLVGKQEVLDAVWKDRFVTENSLTVCIRQIRIALEDNADAPQYIETIPVSGYRFIAEVTSLDSDAVTAAKELEAVPSGRGEFVTISRWMGSAILIAVIVLAYFAYDEFATERAQDELLVEASKSVEEAVEIERWERSIAVLPFVNMSEDPGNEYFSDGLSEEILNLLARIPKLKVIGRTSSFAFKDKNEDLRMIGQTLGVETLLEGSVRKSGDRVRITAQLIDVSNGAQMWSESYDRTMTDIFAVQDDVAAAIIDALQIHVGTAPSRGRPTESLDAYALFLKARAAANMLDFRVAEALSKEVTQLDPNFAEAYELLAYTYFQMAGIHINPAEAQVLASEASAKAIAIDSNLNYAQALHRATIFGPKLRLRKLQAFEQAAHIQPNNLLVLDALIILLSEQGYLEEALHYAERFVEYDPLSLTANFHLSTMLYAVGRTTEAIAALEFTEQMNLDPNFWQWTLVGLNLVEGQDDVAIGYIESWLVQNSYSNPSWFRELVTAPGIQRPVKNIWIITSHKSSLLCQMMGSTGNTD